MSNIKINDVFQRIQYSAAAGQTQFAVPFPFFQDNYVLVWLNGIQLFIGGAPNEYTISGAGSPSGGTVTLNTAAAQDDILTIQGEMPIDRTSIYSPTISNLTGSDLNGDFNREVVMMKQIETTQALLQLQYAPWTVISQDPDVTKDRYIPLLAPQQVWRMNAAGTEIEAVTIDTDNIPAPSNAYYWVSENNTALDNEVNLGLLTSGILKHTVTDAHSTPATAVNAVDYWAPGDALTRTQAPVSGIDVANKTYVDSLAAGLSYLLPARLASTANFAATYDNGTSGIGATLTANANGAGSFDGVSVALGDNIFIKDQTNAFENGVYLVTQLGDASNPCILTRSIQYDTPAEMQFGQQIGVVEGNTFSGTIWQQTSVVTTVGTDNISYQQIKYLSSEQAAYFSSINVQVITSSGTYTPTTNMKYCIVEALGGGGGGGGTPAGVANNATSGGGGGAGSYSIGIFTAAAIGASQSCTIGSGGTGITSATGNPGGITSFGTLITCNGGSGGRANGNSTDPGNGVIGGDGGIAGSGGFINCPGAPGGPAAWRFSGAGGTTKIGGGANGLLVITGTSSNGTSAIANTGAGGSGSYVSVSGAAAAGGNGGSGIIIVTEFI